MKSCKRWICGRTREPTEAGVYMEVSEAAIFSNARSLSSHQSQDNLSQNIILPIEQTTFYWESDWHVFRFISFAEKTCLVKVEKGDQPIVRIQSGQRFGQYKKPLFYRLIGWVKEGEGKVEITSLNSHFAGIQSGTKCGG
jgi:hypothetical protein